MSRTLAEAALAASSTIRAPEAAGAAEAAEMAVKGELVIGTDSRSSGAPASAFARNLRV
jgi:hypothetical protein